YGTGLSGWQGPSGGRDGCLQRLRYTGDPVLMVESFSVVEGGVELKFSFDVDPATVRDKSAWRVQMWNYLWSRVYGSEQWSILQPGRIGRDDLEVEDVFLIEPDKVRLVLPELTMCDQLFIDMNFKTAETPGGISRFVEQLYATIHHLPNQAPVENRTIPKKSETAEAGTP
ncbi:MAG: hypothetical protein AAF802_31650, partial [Planctomycetota bacterium]